jgi:hypothetical protein
LPLALEATANPSAQSDGALPVKKGIASSRARRRRVVAKEQLSVKVEPDQREFLERMAAREDRTVSALLRHIVADWARARQAQQRAAGA